MKNNSVFEEFKNEWSNNSIRLILTPSVFAKSQLFYAQEAGYFETTKGYFAKRKNLNSFLILYTISGNGTLIYNGEQYLLSQGNALFINCQNEHSYKIINDSPWVFNWVHFNGLNSLSFYEKYYNYNKSPVCKINDNELNDLIQSVILINQIKRNSNEILTSLKITEITTLLILMCQSYSSDFEESNYLIDKIVLYINKHFAERLTLNKIANEFCMEKFYLHKQFKKYINTPLNEFIINSRMNVAKERLRFSEMSIKEIAESVGIVNVSHFINLFKKREGSTPLQYRISWKESTLSSNLQC